MYSKQMGPGQSLNTDLESHHIEGFARAAMERGIDAHFSIPLITQVIVDEEGGELWQGGCINGVALPEDFDLVLSLYPWEKYKLGPNTKRIEVEAYDSPEQDPTFVLEVADIAYKALVEGKKVLVHCQAGLNRSGLVAALVLRECGFTSAEAINILRSSRSPVVLCNESFENWLLELDEEE